MIMLYKRRVSIVDFKVVSTVNEKEKLTNTWKFHLVRSFLEYLEKSKAACLSSFFWKMVGKKLSFSRRHHFSLENNLSSLYLANLVLIF